MGRDSKKARPPDVKRPSTQKSTAPAGLLGKLAHAAGVSAWQAFFVQIREAGWFRWGIVGVIILAGVVIGLETSPALMASFGGLLHALDKAILAIFILEIVVKILAEGRHPWRFFKDPWNIFDFLIVAVLLIPVGDTHFAAVLRLARIFRVLRLVTAIPRLKFLVDVLLRSIPSMGYVGLLLVLIFYIYAVLGVFLFRTNDPAHFGDLPTAFLSLFRIVTLEDWTDIMYTGIYGADVYPSALVTGPLGTEPQGLGLWAALYFVSFVLCGSLVVLNLFIGVIVNGIHELHAEAEKREMAKLKEQHPERFDQQVALKRIEEELANLRKILEADRK